MVARHFCGALNLQLDVFKIFGRLFVFGRPIVDHAVDGVHLRRQLFHLFLPFLGKSFIRYSFKFGHMM